MDHDDILYSDFERCFYAAPPDLAALSEADVALRRAALDVRVLGGGPAVALAPVARFGQCGFDAEVLRALRARGFESPTAVQAAALPVVLSGRDVLACAPTGSGKTLAYLLPALPHVLDQEELAKGEGPIALVLAPARELAAQILAEARRLARPYGLRCAGAFGGASKLEQFRDWRAGAEVGVATPGRLIDLVKGRACSLRRVTYLVLDEADRMLELGFEPQVRSVLAAVRPDRQTLLFSATMPRRAESLAAEALADPVRVVVGRAGAGNADVLQHVEVLAVAGGGENAAAATAAKFAWLTERLEALVDQGEARDRASPFRKRTRAQATLRRRGPVQVLIFVATIAAAAALCDQLCARGVRCVALHGDLDQASRADALRRFKARRGTTLHRHQHAPCGLRASCRRAADAPPRRKVARTCWSRRTWPLAVWTSSP